MADAPPPPHGARPSGGAAARRGGLSPSPARGALEPKNRRNGVYGEGTRHDINLFKHRQGITPVEGVVWGSRAWQALDATGSLGAYDHARIDKQMRLIAAARAARERTTIELVHELAARARLAAVWIRFYEECRATYVYGQYRPMPSGLFVPDARTRLDCSSTFKNGYREAGLNPPDNIPYDTGAGWTGSLWVAGQRGEGPPAGDAAFYGWDSVRNAPKHVACCISSSEVVSFGHTPIERYPLKYRSDFLGCRSYLS